MQFTPLSLHGLRNEPRIQTLQFAERTYQVEYLAFCLPENQHKTPVVLLGGAFQSFVSFKNEVELIYATHPVILADFPSQGGNSQLAPELSLEDYAQLIELFCQAQDLNKVMMLGISYGSALAMLFATAQPERVERLLLSGITCFRRSSLITLLNDSLQQLACGNMKAFASTAVCNLLNHSRLEETQVGHTYRRMLFRQVSRLNENEQARYAQNTQRLLDFAGFTHYPSCPTLIATGEYDNFTTPAENAAVAMRCSNATFALIANADHLSQHQRQQETSTLFHSFMCNRPLAGLKGIRLLDPRLVIDLDKRLQDRFRPLEQPYALIDEGADKKHIIRIHNINFAGLEFELTAADFALTEASKQLFLELPETQQRYHIRILERNGKTLRAIIIQRDLKAADALLNYLNNYALLSRQGAPKQPQPAAI